MYLEATLGLLASFSSLTYFFYSMLFFFNSLISPLMKKRHRRVETLGLVLQLFKAHSFENQSNAKLHCLKISFYGFRVPLRCWIVISLSVNSEFLRWWNTRFSFCISLSVELDFLK